MIIVISGKGRAGKDTFGKMLQKYLNDNNHNYVLMAYADVLKQKLMSEFDLSYEQLFSYKKEVGDIRYPKIDHEGNPDASGSYWTPRELMQFIGTDVYRRVDYNYWVKALFKEIKKFEFEDVIITDGRFPNEIDIVKDAGGVHIRIERDVDLLDQMHGRNHASETALDDVSAMDYIIENNGSLRDLEDSAFVIAGCLK